MHTTGCCLHLSPDQVLKQASKWHLTLSVHASAPRQPPFPSSYGRCLQCCAPSHTASPPAASPGPGGHAANVAGAPR